MYIKYKFLDWLISIIFWWPWLNFINDTTFLQFLIYYTIYLVFFTKSVYFSLFYIFLQFIYLGLVLSIFNLDLFTAFLWLAESVIVFVSILMLFYLNVYGNVNKISNKITSIKYYGIFFVVFLISFVQITFSEKENFITYDMNFFNLWDDFYEALYNERMNDLYTLYLSYYILNSLEFIIIGLLLLVASIICVNINKYNKSSKSSSYTSLLNMFDLFNDLVKFYFIRKQNLTDQNNHNPSIKIFKRKTKK